MLKTILYIPLKLEMLSFCSQFKEKNFEKKNFEKQIL